MATGMHYVGLAAALVGLLLLGYGAFTYRKAEMADKDDPNLVHKILAGAEELRAKHEMMIGALLAVVGGGIAYMY